MPPGRRAFSSSRSRSSITARLRTVQLPGITGSPFASASRMKISRAFNWMARRIVDPPPRVDQQPAEGQPFAGVDEPGLRVVIGLVADFGTEVRRRRFQVGRLDHRVLPGEEAAGLHQTRKHMIQSGTGFLRKRPEPGKSWNFLPPVPR